MAKKAKKPDYHHMDLKDLRAYKVNLDAESVKKLYKAYRNTYEKSGQKGKMPEATLLHVAATPALTDIPKPPIPVSKYKRPQLNRPPREEVKNGSEQPNGNVRGTSEGSSAPAELGPDPVKVDERPESPRLPDDTEGRVSPVSLS